MSDGCHGVECQVGIKGGVSDGCQRVECQVGIKGWSIKIC